MYETPDQKDLNKIIINKDVVKAKIKPMLMFDTKNNQKIAGQQVLIFRLIIDHFNHV